ncbi:uncharacterized protein BDR25DRAFT_219408 [Lindgomyces ingoldianus]|uniref:Uncharacterized protein n=1 Tax=Lindgomyces ingoldianus TaxID=673940 RepID=A0ACB6R331_9PLEO|nr:uncharacterized protein BDR25DRAFT_219408 [Lindgomyces ingoldianus]KAF2472917.1 hypothetical protein BDR25DRAFT_219408 [Lindgomyces ingoldianus]
MGKTTARLPRKWTIAEDQKLREEVEAQSMFVTEGEVKDWCRIAAKLPGRTNKDCRKRWHNSVAGGLKKGQWAKTEDVQLSRGVQKFGQRWTLVADVVGSRSADQCAKRWQQSLNPELDRSEWRDYEDKVLITAVQKLGRHWKDIQHQHFPGRSKNCIKNRYTVLLRRYQNQGIPLPEGAELLEPHTPSNRTSPFSGTDDDSMSFTPSMYDDSLCSQTQVSTPDTHTSWSLDDEPFTGWSPQSSFNITSSPSVFGNLQQHDPHSAVSNPSPWNWTEPPMSGPPATTSIGSPTIMSLESPRAHPAKTSEYYGLTPPALSSYGPYATAQAMLAPTSAPTNRPENRASFPGTPVRSSPVSSGSLPYYDPEAVARFYKYGMQSGPPFRMI